MSKSDFRQTVRTAFITSLPVMTGYIVLGIGFGLMLQTKGLGVPWALGMSMIVYAGSLQFVAVEMIGAHVSLLTAALTALAVNARHLFYGISMLDKYKNTGKKKPFLIFWLTDETYSLVCSDSAAANVSDRPLFWLFISMFDYIYWNIGSVLGVLIGSLIPFDMSGVEFSLTALFVTIFVEQWRGTADHRPALIGLAASLLCLLVFGADSFLIPAMLLIAAALTLLHGKDVKRHA